jgi:PAS domain S-box-containing protein
MSIDADLHQTTIELDIARARIAELEDALEAAQREAARSRRMFEEVPIGIIIWDRDVKIRDWNPHAETLFGWSKEEMLGKSFFDYIIPEEVKPYVGNVVETLLTNKLPGEALNQNVRRDGSRLTCQWFNRVVHDENGEIVFVISMATDVTEREQTAREMNQQREFLRQIIDISPNFVYAKDAEGKFVLVNKAVADYYGTTTDAMIGKTDAHFNPNLSEAEAFSFDDRWVLRTGAMVMVPEEIVTRSDGATRTFQTSKVPLKDANGKVQYVLGVSTDITERKRAEQAVQESRNLLQLVLDTIPVRVFWKLRDYTFAGCNRLFAQDAGLNQPEDLIGKDDYQLFPNDAHMYRSDDERVMTTGESRINYEEPQTTPDGKTIWVRTSKIPLRDTEGNIIGVMATYDDITERKHAEQALREREAQLRSIIENAPLVFATLDPDGTFTLSEGKALATLGLQPGQVVGGNLYQLYADFPDIIGYFDRAKAGETAHFVTQVGEARFDTWFSPVFDADGSVTSILNVSVDITERAKAEEALRASEERFRAITDQSTDIITILKADGTIAYEGGAVKFIMGCEVSELIGRNAFEFIHPDDAAKIGGAFRQGMDAEGTAGVTYRWRHADGTWIVLESVGTNLLDNPAINGYLINSRDITERVKAEEALRANREQLLAIANNVPGMLYQFSAGQKWQMDYVSDGVEALAGVSAAAVMEDISVLINTFELEDTMAFTGSINRAVEKVEPWEFEGRLVNQQTGETRWWQARSVPSRLPDGKVIFNGIILDITEQKRAEVDRDRLVAVVANSSDYIGITDAHGIVTYVNPAGLRMKGLPEDFDVRGKPIAYFEGEEKAQVIGATILPDVINKGTTWQGETTLLHSDGHLIPVEQTIFVARDKQGNPFAFATIMRDITARKRAEEDRDRLVAVVENSSDYIGITDVNGIVTYVNPAGLRMKGLPEDFDVRGKPIAYFEGEEKAQVVGATILPDVIGKGTTWQGETTLLHADGHLIPVEQTIFVARDKQGNPFALATIMRDITERKHAEDERELLLASEHAARMEAQEAVRLKDLFLATMSHELRTPLNAIIGYQHLMMFSGQLDDDNTHMTERTLANSQRLLHLINDILDISRIASGGLKIVPVEMSVRDMAATIHDNMTLLAKEKALALTYSIDPALPATIRHDIERISQIVTNLVNNAIKFTDEGSVDVRYLRDYDRLVIAVHDTGVGIPSARLHTIFDDFVQVDNTATRKHQGAGLGLSIVRRLALLMNGSVRVESELGQGSAFTVELPLNLINEAAANN